MSIFELEKDRIVQLPETSFSAEGVKERQDLQRILRSRIEVLDPDLLIIAEEYGDWEESRRRIDLLALDRDAKLVEDLKRLPSVTRLHFIECAGNASRPQRKTVQETHGMTSCAEWTGVLLSVLLKEAGVKDGAPWIVCEGTEEVKGASSIPMAKAMDDCLVAYGMNGEALRPQQGFPLRLMVPGFEGIFHTKYLRRIKVVDRYYMTYNDYGHLTRNADAAALGYQIGPKSVITFCRPAAARPRILRDQRLGLVRWGRHPQGGGIHRRRPALDGRRDSGDGAPHGA